MLNADEYNVTFYDCSTAKTGTVVLNPKLFKEPGEDGEEYYKVPIYVDEGSLNIYGGNFINNTTAAIAQLHCYEGNALNIYGGSFVTTQIKSEKASLNNDDSMMFAIYNDGQINISGGDFEIKTVKDGTLCGYFCSDTGHAPINVKNLCNIKGDDSLIDFSIHNGYLNIDKSIDLKGRVFNVAGNGRRQKISDSVNSADLTKVVKPIFDGFLVTCVEGVYYFTPGEFSVQPTAETLTVDTEPKADALQWYFGKIENRQMGKADVNQTTLIQFKNYNETKGTFKTFEMLGIKGNLRSDEHEYRILVSEVTQEKALYTVEIVGNVPNDVHIIAMNFGGDEPFSQLRGDMDYILFEQDPKDPHIFTCDKFVLGTLFIYANEEVEVKVYCKQGYPIAKVNGETSNKYTGSRAGYIGCEATWKQGAVAECKKFSQIVYVPGYTVTYNTLGGSEIPEDVFVKGKAAEKPEDPTKKDYKFTGWYTDEACTQLYDFSTKLDKDITLYAGWRINFSISDSKKLSNTVALLKKFSSKPMLKSKKEVIKFTWGRVDGADGYELLANECGKKLKDVVADVKQTKKTKKTISVTINSFSAQDVKKKAKINPKSNYKFIIRAYVEKGGERFYITDTPDLHVAGRTCKYANAESLKVDKNITVKKGKTVKIKATVAKTGKGKYLPQRHGAKVRFYSSNEEIATVNKGTGKVKGVKAGKCKIYAVTLNGILAETTVKVKK